VLTIDDGGREGLEFRRVPYDVDRLVATIRGSGMPEPERQVTRYRRT
jgi:hypothetical protein